MPQVSIKIKVTNATAVADAFEDLNAAIPQIGRQRLKDAAEEVLALMQVVPEPPEWPIHWDTYRQLRAFFASGGFGGGIPTVRTGIYVGGWKVEPVGTLGYRVSNPLREAKYIGGLQSGGSQSSIHGGRWQLLRDAIDQVTLDLPEEVATALRKFVARGMEDWRGGPMGVGE